MAAAEDHGYLIWTTSSTSAGVERKFFGHIIIHITFHACAHLGPPLFWRTGSTRLDWSTHQCLEVTPYTTAEAPACLQIENSNPGHSLINHHLSEVMVRTPSRRHLARWTKMILEPWRDRLGWIVGDESGGASPSFVVASALVMGTPLNGFFFDNRTVYRNDLRNMDVACRKHFANFPDQWWRLLAKWTGHYHGIKFFTSGMNAFGALPRSPRPNHDWEFVFDTFGGFAGMKPWLTRLLLRSGDGCYNIDFRVGHNAEPNWNGYCNKHLAAGERPISGFRTATGSPKIFLFLLPSLSFPHLVLDAGAKFSDVAHLTEKFVQFCEQNHTESKWQLVSHVYNLP